MFETLVSTFSDISHFNLQPNARNLESGGDTTLGESRCETARATSNGGVRRFAPLVQHVGTSNLVDPASSHTLVSKIKPCMSKYKQSIL